MERALEIAISMETSARDAAQLHRSQTQVDVHNVATWNGEKTKPNTSSSRNNIKVNKSDTNKHLLCFRCGDSKHLANNCNKKNLHCNKCKTKGHLGKVCLKVKNDTRNSNVDQIDEILSITTQYTEYPHLREKFTVQVQVNKVSITFELDTGAAVTLIGLTDFKNYFPDIQLQKTDTKLVTYSKQQLTVVGFAQVQVAYHNVVKDLNLYVVHTDKHALLGREWMRKLGISFTLGNSITQITSSSRLENLLQKYSTIRDKNMGKIIGLQARLKLKKDTQPFFIKARKVPYSLLPKVEKELEFLENEGILQKIESSEFATPIVPVIKANGNIRICGDFKCTLNPNLIVDEYPLPTLDTLFSSMSGGDKFTKLDLQQAYLQMEVHPEDRKYLTLSTPKGLYRSTRLMYGVASAPAIWQREIENILKDIPGVSVFLDDIKITGPDDDTHFQRLEEVFSRLAKYNIRINYEKCQFFTKQIEYCGYILDKYGVHKCKNKMDAIQNAKVPSNKTEVRAFVGLVNYYNRFLKNLSSTLKPIYNLLKENTPFNWDKNCQVAFNSVKKEIMSDRVLAHFDPNLPLILATDASPYAVGAVLSHVYPDGSERPIQFASQTLTPVQQKYAQIDKEAYAIIFGIKKFYYFLYGRPFILYVDNQPLIQIFSHSKKLPTLTTTRMQHYALFMQGFQYQIKYKNTKSHCNADALSRLPVTTTSEFQYDTPDKFEIFQIDTLPVTGKELERETLQDPTLKPFLQALKTGVELKPKERFNIPQIEFTLQNNCIFRQQMAVIPKNLQNKILQELHSAHFGVLKMKSLARGHCWWPGISYDIERICKNCIDCNKIKANPEKVPLHSWEVPTKPFERVHLDFAGPFMNAYYFILVDAYTRWPEIHIIKNITTLNTVTLLRKIFATYGLPKILVSDNGPSLVSYEFKKFLQENGIRHTLSAPYHPATNGLAEKYVQTLKQSLKALGGSDIEREKKLSNVLLQYRKTPHSSTGVSPAYMMFGRDIRSRLDILRPEEITMLPKPQLHINKTRELQVGERVACRDNIHEDKWVFGNVKERLEQLHYIIQLDNANTWKRHIDQIRSIGETIPITPQPCNETTEPVPCETSTTAIDNSVPNSETEALPSLEYQKTVPDLCNRNEVALPSPSDLPQSLRRSSRTIQPPNRLNL